MLRKIAQLNSLITDPVQETLYEIAVVREDQQAPSRRRKVQMKLRKVQSFEPGPKWGASDTVCYVAVCQFHYVLIQVIGRKLTMTTMSPPPVQVISELQVAIVNRQVAIVNRKVPQLGDGSGS